MFPFLGVLAGVGAAVGWGVGDFFAGKSSRRIGPYSAAFLSVLLGFAAAVIIYLLLERNFGAPSLRLFGELSVLVLLMTMAQIAFYKALEIGPVGIVATLGSAYPMLTVPLAMVFLGEKLTPMQLAAIATVILGVVLTSIQFGGKKITLGRKQGIFLALAAMVLWGISFAFLDPLVGELGWMKANFLEYVLFVFWEAVVFRMMGIGVRQLVAPGYNRIVVANSLSFVFGNVFFNWGLEKGMAAMVTPVSSAYPVLTVLLSWIFLKEHLKKNQLLGIGLVVAGVILLAIFS